MKNDARIPDRMPRSQGNDLAASMAVLSNPGSSQIARRHDTAMTKYWNLDEMVRMDLKGSLMTPAAVWARLMLSNRRLEPGHHGVARGT
jgi:hypothetical protein